MGLIKNALNRVDMGWKCMGEQIRRLFSRFCTKTLSLWFFSMYFTIKRKCFVMLNVLSIYVETCLNKKVFFSVFLQNILHLFRSSQAFEQWFYLMKKKKKNYSPVRNTS